MQKNDNTSENQTEHPSCVIGLKQFRRAVKDKTAQSVLVAKDIDKEIYDDILAVCKKKDIEVTKVQSSKELGKAYGISVATCVVTNLKQV